MVKMVDLRVLYLSQYFSYVHEGILFQYKYLHSLCKLLYKVYYISAFTVKITFVFSNIVSARFKFILTFVKSNIFWRCYWFWNCIACLVASSGFFFSNTFFSELWCKSFELLLIIFLSNLVFGISFWFYRFNFLVLQI